MLTYDLSPLYRSAIGFDRFARLLNDAQRNGAESGFPPYNIELLGEDKYRIVMEVPGFTQDELEVELDQRMLRIIGYKESKDQDITFLHHGMTTRGFEHKFQLDDHVKVTTAKLENGLLQIELLREVPEALKPRKVEIEAANDKQLLEKKAA